MPDKADLLAQFQRKPESRAPRPMPAAETPGEYVAFKAVDKARPRLSVRPASGAWERLNYNYLLRIVENEEGTHLALVFTFCVVVIRGRNLRLITDAIDMEGCEFIQQYDEKKWPMPEDLAAPFIESMDIHVESLARASDDVRTEIAG